MNQIEIAELRKLLDYNPITGVITWRVDYARQRCGEEAGWIDPHGYRRMNIYSKKYYAHRVAFALQKGYWPSKRIDHKNGDGTDNRWENLRPSTQSQNMGNTRIYSNNTSGVKGVYWHRASRKWLAQIKINGRLQYLGIFERIDDAAKAYQSAAMSAFGEFARFQ